MIFGGTTLIILNFTRPIYDMLIFYNTDKSCVHLVFDMWDSMIEKMKGKKYIHKGKK